MSERNRPDFFENLERVFLTRWEDRLAERAVHEGLLTGDRLKVARESAPGARLSRTLLARNWLSQADLDRLADLLKDEQASPDLPLPPEAAAALADATRRFADFILVDKLGSGGAAEVWKAWDRSLGRWVAIKIPRFLPDSRTAAERFEREARAAARLNHPNIVPIHRVAEEGGRPYLVLHYVEGKVLAGERMEFRQAAEVVRTIATAVQHAHEQGVIHRDIKPGNLLLDRSGTPWIFDFGLVYLPEESRAITLPGTLVGTPSYMSPEQTQGADQAHGPSTDVYSLGATLYEMATGQAPFLGASISEIVVKVQTQAPIPPRKLAPGLEPDLERIILKAMEKEPARRYGSASELAADLDRFLAGHPVEARSTTVWTRLRRGFSRRPWATAAGTAMLILLGAVALRTPPPLPSVAPPEIILGPDDAVLSGPTLGVNYSGEKRIIAGWNSTDCTAEWFVNAPQAGWYRVELTFSAGENNGGKYSLATDRDEWTGNIPSTGSWERYERIVLGTIRLPAEKSRLRLKAAEVRGGLFNFKRLRLLPAS